MEGRWVGERGQDMEIRALSQLMYVGIENRGNEALLVSEQCERRVEMLTALLISHLVFVALIFFGTFN